MSKNRYTDLVCILVTVLMLGITALFMNAGKFGVTAVETDKTADIKGTFSARDLDPSWEESAAVHIDLSGMEGLRTGGAYELEGDLYIIAKGTYVLSGTLTDHKIIVNAKDCKLQIVLDNVTITGTDQPAIWIKKADKVFLTLAEDSINTVACTGGFLEEETDYEINAAIYSRSDLTLNGSGTLNVTCTEYNGIRTSDDLIVTGGTYNITAGENAMVGHDSLRICGGTFALDAGKDGLKANNEEERGYVFITGGSFDITSANDAVQAETDLIIEGGDFTILTGSGSASVIHAGEDMGGMPGEMPVMSGNGEMPEMPAGGMEPGAQSDMPGEMPEMPADGMEPGAQPDMPGELPEMPAGGMGPGGQMSEMPSENQDDSVSAKALKAGSSITIKGGAFRIDSEDDALHSGGTLTIEDGEFNISSGDDGIHADGTVTMNGGAVTIAKAYEGIEGNHIYVNGGDVNVTADDDGFNAGDGSGEAMTAFSRASGNSSDSDLALLEINGGTIAVNAEGDGLDSNGDLIINGGTIYVSGPDDDGNGALDSGTESGGDLVINGGTIIALGNAGMAESFSSNSAQAFLAGAFGSSYTAGDTLAIADSSGNVIFTFTAVKKGNSIIFSSPELREGETCTVTCGSMTLELTAGFDGTISGAMSQPGQMDGMHGGGMERPDEGTGEQMPDMPEGGNPGEMPGGPGGMPPDMNGENPMGPGGNGGQPPQMPAPQN